MTSRLVTGKAAATAALETAGTRAGRRAIAALTVAVSQASLAVRLQQADEA